MLEFANAYLKAASPSLLGMGAQMGLGMYQGHLDQKAVDRTIKRQERNATIRASQRHAKLREVISAQRVNLAGQGRTGATSAMLAAKSLQEMQADASIDRMETGDAISDLRTKAKSAWLGRIAETAGMGLKYAEGEREKQLLKKKGE